jgi:hypothetical protein
MGGDLLFSGQFLLLISLHRTRVLRTSEKPDRRVGHYEQFRLQIEYREKSSSVLERSFCQPSYGKILLARDWPVCAD